ncbi:hypothetical protein [Desulfococcus multivorans]|uniref:Transmembrane protein n=1 Tax=Desulfococcus multivorans DSM 2059 TaxID=1121405 RepID=S7UZJ8_DESML|nr:hypothetical protein [Desulfococcus multivorans]AOY59660.1 conserved uncharacterized protein [Desulfococcus multivorans]AQV01844.1 hypothetical protein B2D07_14440 [Desulfococcus multivorans]EPR37853.1 hypothetical protein dsmv_2893 [Desulfococcus multivorans DSM 2059]SKA16581.1 hypothetical protein SAMN02745446_03060 [Desulfococcus multivorans DSM 2059]
MDFKSHLETAWHLTLKYIVSLLLITLVMGVVSFLSLGILAPVTMAGYMQSILMMVRSGREPKIQDLFSEMRLFLPLLAFGIVVAIASMIGFSILFLPGIVIVCGVTFVCLYMMPLMTDRNFGLIDAVKESFRIVTGDGLMDHVIVAILFMGISAIGSSVFVGWLFTQPLATVFLMRVYEEKVAGNAPTPPATQPPFPPEGPDKTRDNSEDEITLKYKM